MPTTRLSTAPTTTDAVHASRRTLTERDLTKRSVPYLLRRTLLLLAVAIMLLVGALTIRWLGPITSPRSEQADRVVGRIDQPASSAPASLDEALEEAVARIRQNDTNAAAYAELGALLLQRVRLTGDAAEYIRAGEAFDTALSHDPTQLDALVGQAVLAAALHDFEAALTWAEQARAINPYRADLYGIMADAYVELGDYEAAIDALDEMMARRPGLNAYVRAAYLRELHGDMAGAIEAMRAAAASGVPGEEPTVWTITQLGHLYFNQGDLRNAAEIYRAALSQRSDYIYALAGLAHVQAAQGETDAAIEAYRSVVARLPLPEFALALGELLQATGDEAGAAEQFELVQLMQQLNEAAGMDVELEMARYHADHGDPTLAVQQAEAVYATRPTIYAADTLAWALYRSGNAVAAQPYSSEALRLGTQDATLYYHAGMIALATGNDLLAQAHLTQALAINPHFSPLYAPQVAATLAELRANNDPRGER